MKNIFLFLTIICILFCAACEKDKSILPTIKINKISLPVSSTVTKLAFINSTVGYAVCNDGVLLKTTDAGNSWFLHPTFSSTYNLTDIQFPSSTTGYILGSGYLYKTTNAGVSWHLVGANIYPEVIDFPTPSVGYCISGNSVYGCANGGVSWGEIMNDIPSSVFLPNKIAFASKDTGYFSDFNQNLYQTLNGGGKWTEVFTYVGQVSKIKFQSKNIGYILNREGTINRTTDGGFTWNTVFEPAYHNEWPLIGIDLYGSTGFVVGNGSVVVSKDNGESWSWRRGDNGLSAPDGLDIQMINETTGFGCGENGLIYKISL